MSYQLGIDVGTTYTAAAVCRSSDRRWVEPEVVTLGTRSATVPSVLFVAPDGGVLVGEAAERRAVTDPDRVVRQFKRRIGDPTPVVVAGRAWAPEDLSARLVRWVANRVAEREGGPADRIAITHPASWGQHKKDLFGAALAAQGLVVTFLAEPQAAALHYAAAERVGPGSTIAVYDLGGGTFDAAVVRKGDPGTGAFALLGRPQGLERLGGIDFDDVVFEHVLNGMPDAFADLDETDPAVLSAVARIRRECVEAKEALSSDTEVSIPVLLPASQGSVRLHRSEFEAMIRPQIEETVTALRGAVGSAGLAAEELTAVLLVGGSSRIPLVAQLVSEQFGRPVAVDADPKNAIAKGAALSISPMPTASWPGVVVPPVPPGGPMHHGQPGRPPAGPPTPPGGHARAREPQPMYAAGAAGYDSAGYDHGGYEAAGYERGGYYGDGYEAAATTALPPERPRVERDEADWDRPAPRRSRPSGLLVGVGGVAAVAAVVLATILWPHGASPSEAGLNSGVGATPTAGAQPPAPPTSRAPAAGEHGLAGTGEEAERPTEERRERETSPPAAGDGGASASNPPAAPPPATSAPDTTQPAPPPPPPPTRTLPTTRPRPTTQQPTTTSPRPTTPKPTTPPSAPATAPATASGGDGSDPGSNPGLAGTGIPVGGVASGESGDEASKPV